MEVNCTKPSPEKQMNRQTERDTRQTERNGKVSRQTESYEDRRRNRHTKIKLTYRATGRRNTNKHIIGLKDGHSEIWTQRQTEMLITRWMDKQKQGQGKTNDGPGNTN
jgi:hypothetical protein